MLWLIVACSKSIDVQKEETVVEGNTLQIIYGNNMDGEIEPCG